jgi:RNA polymerase sigma-70 factor (ECF subfamily)
MRFSTTHWSVVLAAGDSQNPDSRTALATLCQGYWYPIYAYLRSLGHDPEAAQDLVQGFFVHILEKRSLRVARPDRGRFRSFLKTALRHHIINEWERGQAQKRGGGERHMPIDTTAAESRFHNEPAAGQSPERAFEKRWAGLLLTRTLDQLREEMMNSGAPDRLHRLEPFLTGLHPTASYGEVAADLDMSVSAVKVAVHRMRRRFGQLLRQEVAQTVDDPSEIDGEIRYLFSVIDS